MLRWVAFVLFIAGFFLDQPLPSNVTGVRFCWRPSGTDNNCTAWRAA
ncbi:hypothetical protein AB0M50_52985 [Nonomuraea fuscirosea]